jgi:hypothetical protein
MELQELLGFQLRPRALTLTGTLHARHARTGVVVRRARVREDRSESLTRLAVVR